MAEEHQLDRIERMVCELYTQSGGGEIDPNFIHKEAVRELTVALCEALATNQIIPAIKVYRTLTGAGLKEAKDAVVAARR